VYAVGDIVLAGLLVTAGMAFGMVAAFVLAAVLLRRSMRDAALSGRCSIGPSTFTARLGVAWKRRTQLRSSGSVHGF